MARGKVFLALLGAICRCEATGEVQVVLDDMDGTVVTQVHNNFEGSFQPCMKDAYEGQFHHDWAQNKGNAHFTMSFDPPESGCYEIEEYHPGGDSHCARYLPRNARLDVEYCKGLSTSFIINQAANAAQWNRLGSLMFYEGYAGKFIMSNSVSEQCDASHCFLVADAFRLTKTGNVCTNAVAKTPELRSETASNFGLLELGIIVDSDGGGSELDANMQLRKHKGAIELALAAHFAYDQIEVSGIRLLGDRRLQETRDSSVHNFQVSFAAYGHVEALSEDPEALRILVNAKLASAGAGLEVAYARVIWDDVRESSSRPSAVFILVVASSALGLCALLVGSICLRRHCKRRTNTEAAAEVPKCEGSVNPVHTNGDVEKADVNMHDAKKEQDVDVASCSTGDAVDHQSEHGSSEEGNNRSDSDMGIAQQLAFEGTGSPAKPEVGEQAGTFDV